MTLYVLNAPILTAYGEYRFAPIDIAMARDHARGELQSGVGHAGAAELLSALLDTTIPVRRERVLMDAGDCAIVLRLLQRLPEGRVLTHAELLQWPHELAWLQRLC